MSSVYAAMRARYDAAKMMGKSGLADLERESGYSRHTWRKWMTGEGSKRVPANVRQAMSVEVRRAEAGVIGPSRTIRERADSAQRQLDSRRREEVRSGARPVLSNDMLSQDARKAGLSTRRSPPPSAGFLASFPTVEQAQAYVMRSPLPKGYLALVADVDGGVSVWALNGDHEDEDEDEDGEEADW